MLDREGGWSVSFAGCGFLGVYHIGAATCLQERAPHVIRDARHIYGASAGALAGAVLVGGGSLGQRRGRGERSGEGEGAGAGAAGRAGTALGVLRPGRASPGSLLLFTPHTRARGCSESPAGSVAQGMVLAVPDPVPALA